MKEEIFKLGDRVFHIEYGWGVVRFNESVNFPLLVKFNEGEVISFTLDGREMEESKQPLLSFTEYTLQGFSQERQIVLPEFGELCLVRSKDNEDWICEYFQCLNDLGEYVTMNGDSDISYWSQIKRIKILD